MKTEGKAKKHKSTIVSQLLSEISPMEKSKIATKMALAARLDDLIKAKGWGKSEFAEKLGKQPSEITKWLSGTHNFTTDILTEIAYVLDISLTKLFVQEKMEMVNKVHIIVSAESGKPPVFPATPLEEKDIVGSYFAKSRIKSYPFSNTLRQHIV